MELQHHSLITSRRDLSQQPSKTITSLISSKPLSVPIDSCQSDDDQTGDPGLGLDTSDVTIVSHVPSVRVDSWNGNPVGAVYDSDVNVGHDVSVCVEASTADTAAGRGDVDVDVDDHVSSV